MHSTRVATLAPYQRAMEVCFGHPNKMSFNIGTSRELQDEILKLNLMQLTELHITITETGDNDMKEISKLYEYSKMVKLGGHPLVRFSVTYNVDNTDASNNSARFMILSNFLKQLNWDVCVSTDLHLNTNYVNDDPCLELLGELPVNVSISGKTGSSKADEEEDSVQLIERSYLYLDGYL